MSGERTNLQQKYSDKKIKKYRRINGNLGGRKKEGEREREKERLSERESESVMKKKKNLEE